MERRRARSVSDIDKVWIRVEQAPYLADVAAGHSHMNGMVITPCGGATSTIPRLLQEQRRFLMAAISRHRDQATVVQTVPLRIRSGLEEKTHRLGVPFADGEVNGRRIPIVRAAEARVALEEAAERSDIAVGCGRERVPDDVAICGFELVWPNHRLGGQADHGFYVLSQRIPRVEAVLLSGDALRVSQAAKLRLMPETFFRLTLELIEVGTSGQNASTHDGPPSETRLKSANRPKEGRAIDCP
jgi:hypothetical protein